MLRLNDNVGRAPLDRSTATRSSALPVGSPPGIARGLGWIKPDAYERHSLPSANRAVNYRRQGMIIARPALTRPRNRRPDSAARQHLSMRHSRRVRICLPDLVSAWTSSRIVVASRSRTPRRQRAATHGSISDGEADRSGQTGCSRFTGRRITAVSRKTGQMAARRVVVERPLPRPSERRLPASCAAVQKSAPLTAAPAADTQLSRSSIAAANMAE